MTPPRARSISLLAAFVPLTTLAGCSYLRSAINVSPPLRISSRTADSYFIPTPTIAIYHADDQNSVDLFLTDAPESLWSHTGADVDAESLAGVSAVVIHIHQFYAPYVTRTPIDPTASNTTIRILIIADGQVGEYGGGGFLRPSSQPGEGDYGGDIEGASLRLLRQTDGFVDQLGAAEMSGHVSARLDDEKARQLGAWFNLVLSTIPRRDDAKAP